MNDGADFRTPQNNNTLTYGIHSTLAPEDLQTILNSRRSQNMSGTDMGKLITRCLRVPLSSTATVKFAEEIDKETQDQLAEKGKLFFSAEEL